jgi:hypothetical protein
MANKKNGTMLNQNEADQSAKLAPRSLNMSSTAAERDEVNQAHHQEMAGHLLDNSIRAGHGGHLTGTAGPGKTGHTMPPNDAHLQRGAYIPRAVAGPNLFSDLGSADADSQSVEDSYGQADDKAR